MRKHGFSFKSFYIINVILFCTSLFSCKNFLNAGAVSQEIKDTIEYNNAKTIEITISCKEDQGTIYPQQSYKAKLGYDFEIQFIPNTDNYVIKDPDAIFEAVNKFDPTESRADCVEFTPLERSIEDIKAGIYRIKVKVIKDAGDIMIRPCLTTLPTVVDIYPPFVPSGYAQDTTIKITFSKPMNAESFGNFECISMTSDTGSVKSCYDTPYFSNDYTVLNIPLAKGARLIPKGTTAVKQISISVNTTVIKDFESLPLLKDIIYIYCVNQEMDSKAPVLVSSKLKKTNGSDLSPLDFDNWDKEPEVYTLNHIKDSIDFVIDGYDDESGIGGLRITEKLLKQPDGTDVNNLIQTSDYENFEYLQDSNNHKIYRFEGSHKLTSFYDGIVKLDFQIVDKSDNPSETIKTIYVIKDTQIDSTSIKFLELKEAAKRISDYDSELFTITLEETPKDIFYCNYSSDSNISIKWGYREDDINEPVTQNGSEFSFTHNPNKLTYIQIICNDIVGNLTTINRAIPPRPVFDASCVNITVSSNYPYLYFTPCSYDSLKTIANYMGAELQFYLALTQTGKKNNTTTEKKSIREFDKSYSINYYDYDCTDVYPFYAFSYSDGSFWYSPISNNEIYIDSYGSISANKVAYRIKKLITTNQMNQDLIPEIPDSLKISTTPVKNSGGYKISIETQLDNNYSWTYIFTDTDSGKKQVFTSEVFYMKSPATYKLSLEARDSEANIYTKELQLMQIGNSQPFEQLTLEGDMTPPDFTIYNKKKYTLETNGITLLIEPTDNETGVFLNPLNNEYGEITYYFLPNPGVHICDYTKYTLKELEAYKNNAKKLNYKIGSNTIFIPFGNIEESFYTLCLVVKDNAENYCVECLPVYNKTLKKNVSSGFQNYGTSSLPSYKVVTTFDSINDASKSFQRWYQWKEGAWQSKGNVTASTTTPSNQFISNNITSHDENNWFKFIYCTKYDDSDILSSEAGFYNITYRYFGSGSGSGSNKNMWMGVNGVQISSNSNILVHTLYSESKLTETNEKEDAAIWLLKGFETGVKTYSKDALYPKENYNNIPKGCYYTVIVQYSDGDMLMTEVKQKQ